MIQKNQKENENSSFFSPILVPCDMYTERVKCFREITVKSENFVSVLFLRTFAGFRENKTLAKWRNTLQFTDVGKTFSTHEF